MKRSETCPGSVRTASPPSKGVVSNWFKSNRSSPPSSIPPSKTPVCASSSPTNLSNNNNADKDARTYDQPVDGAGEHKSHSTSDTITIASLRKELSQVYEALEKKDSECQKLTSDQLQTGIEVQDLTASLFEEANKMVQDANIKRMTAEKLLKEATAKIDVLVAEVTALKALVITSTPSTPNVHLHPQINKVTKDEFIRGHKRSTSHHSLGNFAAKPDADRKPEVDSTKMNRNEAVDQKLMSMFRHWKLQPSLDNSDPLLELIRTEDVLPCLRFDNEELSRLVYDGIISNTITVEPLVQSDDSTTMQCCALSSIPAVCSYCIRIGDLQVSYAVSRATRNRIIAVCDFWTYIRYIAQGLVKSTEEDTYWELMRLRKRMCLARLGFDEL